MSRSLPGQYADDVWPERKKEICIRIWKLEEEVEEQGKNNFES